MPGIHLYGMDERKVFADRAKEILESIQSEGCEDGVDMIANTAVASAWIALAAL